MMQTVIGFVLLASPFLLINKFKEKKLGLAYILSFLIAFHLFVAVATQAVRLFTYPVILAINLIVFLFVIIKTNFKEIFLGFKKNIQTIDWVLISVLFIAFLYLFSVHYNYSGVCSVVMAPKYKQVEHMRYQYPYFADEWYSVAFIKDSINSHSLPIKNPLSPHSSYFINLELPFHSFLSGLMLLLNLNPLTDYTLFTLFFGLLVCLLIYLFLRYSRVNKLPAAIATLSALYVTNGANLPGIWNLLPLTTGIISMLLGFFFIASKNKRMTFFMALITLLFYPPLFIFYTLAVICFFISSRELLLKEKLKNILYYLISVALAGIILFSFYFLATESLDDFFHYILFSKIFYPSLVENAIPRYSIWNIVPIPILILSALGISSVIKKKTWLVSTLFLGLMCWALYSFVTFRFIIDYQRVVFFTAILITITAGFGLSYLVEALKRINSFQKNNSLNYIQIGVLILFLVFSFNYTKRDNWQKLKLVFETGEILMPAAPANNYLHPDDLRLFKNIKNQTFLSLPWKGTVIGIATDNYPLSTKGGTITINSKLFYEFMDSDCNKKYEISKSQGVNYIYSPNFDCPNFEFIDNSEEGLYLYKFTPLEISWKFK